MNIGQLSNSWEIWILFHTLIIFFQLLLNFIFVFTQSSQWVFLRSLTLLCNEVMAQIAKGKLLQDKEKGMTKWSHPLMLCLSKFSGPFIFVRFSCIILGDTLFPSPEKSVVCSSSFSSYILSLHLSSYFLSLCFSLSPWLPSASETQ